MLNNAQIRLPALRTLILFAVLFGLIFLSLTLASRYTLIKVNIANSHPSNLKIYWKSISKNTWTERNTVSIYVNNRKNNHLLVLPVKFTDITALRIDPTNRKGVQTTLHSITIYSLLNQAINFDNHQRYKKLTANDQVGQLRLSNHSIEFNSTGNDPYFFIDFNATDNYPVLGIQIALALLLCFLMTALIKVIPRFSLELIFVPYAMTFICGLILIMAIVSRENTHPDEVTHIKNAHYYSEHLSPAVSCSDETLFTYSTYGVSRLDNREIAYYLSGRFLQLTQALPVDDYIKLRFINILLFFALTYLSFISKAFRYIALPLLLTPQAWYVFSYFNSDALSLFISFITAQQIFAKNSMLRRLLRGEIQHIHLIYIFSLGLLLTAQFLVKLNFYFFSVFLIMLVISWLLIHRSVPRPKSLIPIGCVVLTGILLFSGWELWRHSVNDFQLAEKSMQCRELTAGPLYKPSTPLEKTHPTFRLKDKGVPFFEMLEQHNWVQRIFYTGLGAYGYTEYMSSLFHYHLASFFILMLVAYLVLKSTIKGDNFNRLTILCAFAAMFGLIAAAALNSWQADLQPQGRYLLVYLPIIGVLMVMNKARLKEKALLIFTLMPFALALISFVFVGFVEIAKI